MLTALVDLLEKKGVITQEEWEQEIKKRLKT
jgi:mannitol/fructose-specific phosphotransferase system IIA component (Ntr-type)